MQIVGFKSLGKDATAETRVPLEAHLTLHRAANTGITSGLASQFARSMPAVIMTVSQALAFAAGYFLLQRFTFTLQVQPLWRSPFFSPAALLLSTLVLTPPRRWVWFFLALGLLQFPLFAGNSRFGIVRGLESVPVFALATGITAWWLRKKDREFPFNNPSDFSKFLLFAIVVIPLITVVPLHLLLLRTISFAEIWPTARNSYLALGMGTAVATPGFLLTLLGAKKWMQRISWRRTMELGGILVGLGAVAAIAFYEPVPLTSVPFILYAPLSLILWLGIRFGLVGASWGLILVAVIGSESVAHRRGSFGGGDAVDDSLHFQLFLLALCVPNLVLSAYVESLGRTRRTLICSQSELAQKESALHLEHERSHELALHLMNAQEQERTRIAGELHDDISQQLAAMSIALSNVKRRLMRSESKSVEAIEEVQKEAARLSEAIRSLSHDLHPAMLEQMGLCAVLRARCRDISTKTGIHMELHLNEVTDHLAAPLAVCLFRVAQESLHNIVKHADATSIVVRLEKHTDTVSLTISDNGRGFEPARSSPRGGLGLVTMRERVSVQNGSFDLRSMPLGGTTIEVRIPLGGVQ